VFDDPDLEGTKISWVDITEYYEPLPAILVGLIEGVVCPDRRSHGFQVE